MKRSRAVLGFALSFACNATSPADGAGASSGATGDGAASSTDSGDADTSSSSSGGSPATSSSESGAAEPPPLMLGVMVHVETQQAWMDPDFLQSYLDRIRDDFLPPLVAHGARFTWQFRGEILARIVETGDPILDELAAAGQGIGVHADKGYPPSSQGAFEAELAALAQQFDAVVPGVRDVSGICSEHDWVAAAAAAGFAYTTGIVSYCVMSLPYADRPPEYADCPAPNICHDVYPPEIERRIHPWRARDGATWLTHDDDGSLVILPSSGGLVCAEEEQRGAMNGCMHTAADTPIFFAELDAALAARDAEQVNAFHVGWSYGAPLDATVTEDWLTQIDTHVARGDVVWGTFDEMHQAYLDWEASK